MGRLSSSTLRLVAVSSLIFAAACSFGELITLGQAIPEEAGPVSAGGAAGVGGFAPDVTGGSPGNGEGGEAPGQGGEGASIGIRARSVRAIEELNTEEENHNPTLSADELLMCFTSKRPSSGGGLDMWCAERGSLDQEFDQPVELSELNTDGFESSSALSLDGLTLWFGSKNDGQVDIFVSQRPDRQAPWSEAQLVESLSSPEDDIPRPPAMASRVMPLASRRDGDDYWTYLARRDTDQSDFSAPILIEELATEGQSIVDAFLTEDGLMLLYKVQNDSEPGDLAYSYRADTSAPFSAPQLIKGVNTPDDERDPWLSPDGQRLYFASDRDGELELYVAEME